MISLFRLCPISATQKDFFCTLWIYLYLCQYLDPWTPHSLNVTISTVVLYMAVQLPLDTGIQTVAPPTCRSNCSPPSQHGESSSLPLPLSLPLPPLLPCAVHSRWGSLGGIPARGGRAVSVVVGGLCKGDGRWGGGGAAQLYRTSRTRSVCATCILKWTSRSNENA